MACKKFAYDNMNTCVHYENKSNNILKFHHAEGKRTSK